MRAPDLNPTVNSTIMRPGTPQFSKHLVLLGLGPRELTVPPNSGPAGAIGISWHGRRIVVQQSTYSLHCSSFLGLPFRILYIELVKPKKGTTMETIGRI